MSMPAGMYTLWSVPRSDGRAELIVNKQSGQWGTEYNDKFDLGTKPFSVATQARPVDKFTISIVPEGVRKGTLVLEWGTFRWTAPIVVT
jgi:hypothetical protein